MRFKCEGKEVSIKTISEVSGKSVATIIDMARKVESGNKITIDGWEYEFTYGLSAPKKNKNLKIEITDRVYSTKENPDGLRLQSVYTYKGKDYLLGEFADLLRVSDPTISTKTRGLASFKLNGEPVTVIKERIGRKYDISKDGEWIYRVTLTEAAEYTGHDYKTLSYHCYNKTYTSNGWCIRRHKPSDK